MNAALWLLAAAGLRSLEQALTAALPRAFPAADLLPVRPADAEERLTLSIRCSAWLASNAEFKNASVPLCPAAELTGTFDDLFRRIEEVRGRLTHAFALPTKQTMQFRLATPQSVLSEAQLDLTCFGEIPVDYVPSTQKVSVGPHFTRWFPPTDFRVDFEEGPHKDVSAAFVGSELVVTAGESGRLQAVRLRIYDAQSGLFSPVLTLQPRTSWAGSAWGWPRVAGALLALIVGAAAGVIALSILRAVRAKRSAYQQKGCSQTAASTVADAPSATDSVLRWNQQLLARRNGTTPSPFQPGGRCDARSSPVRFLEEGVDGLSAIALDDCQISDHCSFVEQVNF